MEYFVHVVKFEKVIILAMVSGRGLASHAKMCVQAKFSGTHLRSSKNFLAQALKYRKYNLPEKL